MLVNELIIPYIAKIYRCKVSDVKVVSNKKNWNYFIPGLNVGKIGTFNGQSLDLYPSTSQTFRSVMSIEICISKFMRINLSKDETTSLNNNDLALKMLEQVNDRRQKYTSTEKMVSSVISDYYDEYVNLFNNTNLKIYEDLYQYMTDLKIEVSGVVTDYNLKDF